ncbi:hypothetical protein [Pseudomonas zhanjiangensis]|uniref:Transcriptional regulatory protein, C terminal n=1 Tax=Pseudomonas zhanjiangensis TaxID=3239015 RepID=A0ABV3YYP3_9PSED
MLFNLMGVCVFLRKEDGLVSVPSVRRRACGLFAGTSLVWGVTVMGDMAIGRAAVEQLAARPADEGNGAWMLDCERRVLLGECKKIALTASEALILKDFVASEQRVLNKVDILACLNRDSGNYTGLVMCISRLQGKFKKVSGGVGLFRSVRNRGYCLVQRIELLG